MPQAPRWRRITTWALAGLLALLLAAAALGWAYSRRALPITQGELALPGLRAELRITRDAHGIPTIRAASVRDAMYGLGVVHAQDRLWQMETHRRIGAGRLAELFGEGALDTDRFLRILGVRQAAQAQWAAVSAPSREALLAYTEGVNAVIASLRARPPEFLVLGVQPEPWTPVDSLSWAIMMAWDLSFNWQTELLRLRLALTLPKDRIDQLLPPYPGDAVPASADYTALYRGLKLDGQQAASEDTLLKLMAAAPPSEVEGTGSNSWVLAGSHTSTGHPLLANDPHLKLSTPALWYFARLQAPGLDVAGATLPGLPGVVVGQNAKIAWGFTNSGPDVQDTYLERIQPDQPTRYQTPDGWAGFATRSEVIKVKGQADVALTVRSSRHGPLLSDAALAGVAGQALGNKQQPGYAIALRWTGLDSDIDIVAATLKMNAAGSVAEFEQATQAWQSPMQNMAVADADGHIALLSPGRVPVRRADNDLAGLAPAPGWDARYDWVGVLPHDQLPAVRDPARGFIANANQKIVPPGYPHYINAYWALPYRHQRIEQLIEAKPQQSLAELGAMQADVKSLAAPRLLAKLQQTQSAHPLAAAAQKALQGFDGTMAADSPAPLILWAWTRHLSEQVIKPRLGTDLYERSLAMRGYFDAIEGVMQRDDAWWCDDPATPATETCADQASRALTDALDELQAGHGADVTAWRWDQAHIARAEHRPFSRVKWLARWFEQRVPVGGDSYTVNVARVSLKPDAATGELYLDEHGPSLRGLYDLADRRNSRVVHSTGQSGIPWSPLFANLAPLWRQVRAVPLFPADALSDQTLVLRPAPAP
jgi:penicillin amidase